MSCPEILAQFLRHHNIDENAVDEQIKQKLTPSNLNDEEFTQRFVRFSKMNQKILEMGLEPLTVESISTTDLGVKKPKKNFVQELRQFLWKKMDEGVLLFDDEELRRAEALSLSPTQYFCVKGNHGYFLGIPVARDVFMKLQRKTDSGSSFALCRQKKHTCVKEYLTNKLFKIANRKMRFPEEISFFERDYLSTVLFLKKARQYQDDSGEVGPRTPLVGTGAHGNQQQITHLLA